METLIKADIFFFITSIAVIILTALLCIALIYTISVLKTARKISNQIKRQVDLLEDDLDEARSYVQKQGFTLKTLLSLSKFFSGKPKRKN